MKKTVAIVLTLIFLLNVIGYYGVFLGLQYNNNRSITQLLDAAELDQTRTFEVKIPMTVAYAGDAEEFTRVSGQFAFRGEYFQMVKQRLAHDTLTVICLKDQQQKHIHASLIDFVKTFTGAPLNKNGSAKTLHSLIKDYVQHSIKLSSQSQGWENNISLSSRAKTFTPSWFPAILHPPERG